MDKMISRLYLSLQDEESRLKIWPTVNRPVV